MSIYLEVIVRLAVAAVLGSLIGLERERLDRGAGLRTMAWRPPRRHVIVSAYGFSDVIEPGRIVLDPSRIARGGERNWLPGRWHHPGKNAIHGLTTAASVGLWRASASPPGRVSYRRRRNHRYPWASCWRSSPSRDASSRTSATGASPCVRRRIPGRSLLSRIVSTRCIWSCGGSSAPG